MTNDRTYKKDRPYASIVGIEQVRVEGASEFRAEIGPHFDLTISAIRSVRVLRAWYWVTAMQA